MNRVRQKSRNKKQVNRLSDRYEEIVRYINQPRKKKEAER